MAGDWLKIEHATPDKTETLAITTAMGWDDPDLTLGKLFRIWRWFDLHTTEGNAPGVTSSLLDRIVGVAGFARAMADVGWLVINPDGVCLPNFGRHNGKTAKARALNAKRVRDFKESRQSVANVAGNAKANGSGNGVGNDASVTSALPREEKIKEKNTEGDTRARASTVQHPDFAAVGRIVGLLEASRLRTRPPEQIVVTWCDRYGEDLIRETLADCEDDYAGKDWKYLRGILDTRLEFPEQRPGRRKERKGNGRDRAGSDDNGRDRSSAGTTEGYTHRPRFGQRSALDD